MLCECFHHCSYRVTFALLFAHNRNRALLLVKFRMRWKYLIMNYNYHAICCRRLFIRGEQIFSSIQKRVSLSNIYVLSFYSIRGEIIFLVKYMYISWRRRMVDLRRRVVATPCKDLLHSWRCVFATLIPRILWK